MVEIMGTVARRSWRALAAAAIVALAGATPAAADGASPGEGVLVVGKVNNNPRETLPRVKGFADLLAARLHAHGIARARIVIVESNGEMADKFRTGAVDVVAETLFSALLFERAGGEIVLREWRRGVAEYRTLIVARADSPVKSVGDLAGRRLAFEDRGSTSGYFLPLSFLRRAGHTLAEISTRQRPAVEGTIGYVFAGDETNVAVWVHRGMVDAGAISDLDWTNPRAMPEQIKQELRVVGETPAVIRSVMVVRRNLPQGLRDGIVSSLLTMHETPDGIEALRAYYNVTRYDALEGDVLDSLRRSKELLLPIADLTN